MTPAEVATKLRAVNDWRRGGDIEYPGPLAVDEAIDAAVEMIDRLEAAEKERDFAKVEIARLHDDIHELTDERDALRAKIERMDKIESAAQNLVKMKGRHNTEIAYQRLVAALEKTQ